MAFLEWGIPYSTPERVREPRPSYLGDQSDVNMFVGEIKFVGTNHIECNYNSFHGCLGGPVVCIDPEYGENMGKVIAIHVGCKKYFYVDGGTVERYNIAFTIATEDVQDVIANSTVEIVREALTTYCDEHHRYLSNN